MQILINRKFDSKNARAKEIKRNDIESQKKPIESCMKVEHPEIKYPELDHSKLERFETNHPGLGGLEKEHHELDHSEP